MCERQIEKTTLKSAVFTILLLQLISKYLHSRRFFTCALHTQPWVHASIYTIPLPSVYSSV